MKFEPGGLFIGKRRTDRTPNSEKVAKYVICALNLNILNKTGDTVAFVRFPFYSIPFGLSEEARPTFGQIAPLLSAPRCARTVLFSDHPGTH